MGPSDYSPERADSITRVQTMNITMGKSKIGRGNFLKTCDNMIGPGQYEDTKGFGTDVKSIKIGERHEEKSVETPGPGTHSPDKADEITRVKTTNITMGSSPSRADFVSKTAATVGPGQYEDSKRFGWNTKTFTIGEKREVKTIETVGPGAYETD